MHDESGDVARANLRFRQVVEAAPTAMVMVNSRGLIELVNTQTELIFGYPREELLGQSIDILLPERFRQQHPHHRAAFFSDLRPRAMGSGRDLYGRRKDGTEFPVEVGLNPIETDDGVKVLSAITDISARKRMEARFRQVVEAAPNAMVMVNKNGLIEMVNPQTERIFGYPREELLGQSIDMLLPERLRHQHAHHRAFFFSELSPRAMGTGRDLYGRRKDGSEFPVEVGLNPIETDDGVKVLSAITDISARVKASEKLAQHRDELERSNKELATFAYVASHDLKSPLRGIFQISHWIEEDLNQGKVEAISGHMSLLRGRLRRMERLLDDLLAYSRAGRLEGSVSQVDLGKVAQSIFEMQAPPAGFSLKMADDLPTFYTLATPLEQVLRNLFSNAIKHHDQTRGSIQLQWQQANPHYYEFSVIDDGPGISPEYQERVYIMFQTLRPRDEVEGSGMGLALVKKIVEAYGGSTSIRSDGQRGCAITFTWPINIEERLMRANPAQTSL
ncbi:MULTISPECIES: PAS domain-containing sensor histidine kinase [unclassified Methylophilus]|jgi:PAS domain S-box-containing protein|uniref:sensor histidine kinase n=1 Tax=unclassified Methylophilus TaxID=2630143 RepID=UPI00188E0C71|nr:PAS domain-containing sensor histidine kinase [Methylophilus sp. 13]MBF5039846.1 PAS domain S-box protein [Methylophilus sp. 13]BEV09268.1 PAS domain-containing sensor histidine kinase [Methylophilus sp. DW102]